MLRPSEFFDTAKRLTSPSQGAPSDADLRRAVSTAYYSLFHTVLAAGADRLFGAADRKKPGYAVVYRSFDHGRLKRICEEIAKSALGTTLQRQLGRNSLHINLRNFARSFVELQAIRHRADYDPDLDLTQSDALAVLERAELAASLFAAAPDDERSDVLALMLGGRT